MSSLNAKGKLLIAIVLAALVGVFVLYSRTSVPAGYVGVRFDLYGGDKGVQSDVVGPGRYYLTPNEEMYLFPTFTQNFTWTTASGPKGAPDESISFQDKEGIVINADVGISYAVAADKVSVIFQKYRKGVDEITDVYLRNMVRDAVNAEASKMDVAEIYGSGKEELMGRVTKRVKEQVSDIGIVLEKIYWIGAHRLPPQITNAINAKIEATQKAQQRENELQTAKAQADIEREKARGEADAKTIHAEAAAKANRLLAESISDRLNEYRKIDKWDGKLPTVSGQATPIINLK